MKIQKYLLLLIKLKTLHQKIHMPFYEFYQSKILNGNKYVTLNVLLDSWLDSTLLPQNVGICLNLNGKEQLITFSNAITQKSKVKSKLVNFSFSSKLHPVRIKFENVWVVDEHNLSCKVKLNFYKEFEHLKNIHFHSISIDVSLLIQTDIPELYLPNKIRKRNKNEPIGIKLVLGSVLLGENKKEKYLLNGN